MKRLLWLIPLVLCQFTWAQFGHVQAGGQSSTGGTPATITLTSNPATGSVVCVGVASPTGAAMTGVTVVDSASNSYTQTPNSPSTFLLNAGNFYLFYLIAPAGATKTLTVAWTSGGSDAGIWVDNFSVSGGTAYFDKDVAFETATGANPIILPSITPTNSASLLWSGMTSAGQVTGPTLAATLGVWTGGGIGATNNNDSEYDLSATGATAVDYTNSSSVGYSGMVMAFYISSSVPARMIIR
jgi:hypothetical protein